MYLIYQRWLSNIFVFDFIVGQRGLARRAPVDDAVTAINPALIVQVFEDLGDRQRQAFVEREPGALPIATAADTS